MNPLRRRSGGPAVLAFALALVLAACGSATPTASPSAAPTSPPPSPTASPSATATTGPTPAASDANAALYGEIEQQVSAIRGIRATKPVDRQVVDVAGIRDYMTKQFDEDTPPELVSAQETLYKSLLLMPQDASLRDQYIELVTSQALGLYDDTDKKMYVVSKSGSLGPIEETAYAHEFTHALQDQRYDIHRLVGEATDQGDRTTARMTLVEGDAYLTMALWQQANLTPAELVELLGAADPASEAALAKLPEIVKQSLLFPATNGISLALREYGQGGFDAINRRFENPPDTTEQVLHPDKLDADEQPVPVTFPGDLAQRLGEGWKVSLEDTLGEFQLEILLRDAGGAESSVSQGASAGWGGDRVALVEGPDGATGVVLDTAWDTKADAGEFADALDSLVAKLEGSGRAATVFQPEPDRVVLVTADSAATLGRLANVLGLAG